MDIETSNRFDKLDEKMDQQHRDVLKAVSSIRETCASCQTQVGMHSGRLAALDDLRDGAVPKLQQNMASLKTKVAAYAGIVSAAAFAAAEAVRSIFFGK